MKIFQAINDVVAHRWIDPSARWGLVPTMGFLHDGHLSLVRRAREENDSVGVSIFVNPIQFNNPDDLANYPHDLKRDLDLLMREGADLVWTPTPDIVYPPDFQTYINVEKVTIPLEGACRPGHFRGVATVVAKLFNVFQPQRAYFGKKDFQQLAVIRQMVKDLNFNIEIIPCPTIREANGLAMSSRNKHLSAMGRQKATCLFQALMAAKHACDEGQRNADHLRSIMTGIIQAVDIAKMDYVSVAHPDTLEELDIVSERAVFSMAVFIGHVRLIDNMEVQV